MSTIIYNCEVIKSKLVLLEIPHRVRELLHFFFLLKLSKSCKMCQQVAKRVHKSVHKIVHDIYTWPQVYSNIRVHEKIIILYYFFLPKGSFEIPDSKAAFGIKKKSTRMEILHLLNKVNLSGLYSLLSICSLKPDSLRNTLFVRKLQLTMQG